MSESEQEKIFSLGEFPQSILILPLIIQHNFTIKFCTYVDCKVSILWLEGVRMMRVQVWRPCEDGLMLQLLWHQQWQKGRREEETRQRRQTEISRATNALALGTQLVCLTAHCTGSWIHCMCARVVPTPCESG